MKRTLSFLGHLIAENDGIQLYVKGRKGKYGMPDYYVFETIDSRHLAIVCYHAHYNNFKEGYAACMPLKTREEFYKGTDYIKLI